MNSVLKLFFCALLLTGSQAFAESPIGGITPQCHVNDCGQCVDSRYPLNNIIACSYAPRLACLQFRECVVKRKRGNSYCGFKPSSNYDACLTGVAAAEEFYNPIIDPAFTPDFLINR